MIYKSCITHNEEYITRIKVSSYLATPSCGGRGVPRSPFYVAWLAEELIHRNEIILL